MASKWSRFVIYPVLPLGDNGEYSISDETLLDIWRAFEREEKVEELFYDGKVRDAAEWLQFIKSPGVYPIIIWDQKKKRIVHICWLKDIFDCCAWIHHCSVGPYQRGAWEVVREYYQSFDTLKLLLGLTPSTNVKALKMVEKICKFTVVGQIPWVCNMAYKGERVPGVVSYFQL